MVERKWSLLLVTLVVACSLSSSVAFTVPSRSSSARIVGPSSSAPAFFGKESSSSSSSLEVVTPENMDVVGMVVGQENYGLAIVALGEGLWSFLEAPSFDHAKVIVPAAVAAVVLCAVSGPMVTSGDPASVTLGLEIATFVSLGLGASYVARLLAPYSPSAKEIAFGGLLVAVAGFFSFSQNLLVDGFVTLPSIPLPSLPHIELPSIQLPF